MISGNRVHAGFYSCLVIFLTAVIIQEILPQKHTKAEYITSVTETESSGVSMDISVLYWHFPITHLLQFDGRVQEEKFFPHLLSHLLFGCRILALLSEY